MFALHLKPPGYVEPESIKHNPPRQGAFAYGRVSPMETVDIFTDGACQGNPGPGGWGAILRYKGVEKEISGFEPQTTNNRMELRAAIESLKTLSRPMKVRLHTDSLYVHDGMTKWLAGWKKKNWRVASNAPVKNQDLWEELDAIAQHHTMTWCWVRGHSGHPENERADALAREAIIKRDIFQA